MRSYPGRRYLARRHSRRPLLLPRALIRELEVLRRRLGLDDRQALELLMDVYEAKWPLLEAQQEVVRHLN